MLNCRHERKTQNGFSPRRGRINTRVCRAERQKAHLGCVGLGLFTSPESLVKKKRRKKKPLRHKGKQWVEAVTDGPQNVKQMSVNLCLFSFGLPGRHCRSFVFVSRRLSIKSLPSRVPHPYPLHNHNHHRPHHKITSFSPLSPSMKALTGIRADADERRDVSQKHCG